MILVPVGKYPASVAFFMLSKYGFLGTLITLQENESMLSMQTICLHQCIFYSIY